jgi:hypothetical protein
VKMLDAAEVQTKASGGWERGWDGDTRPCGGMHVYLSDCDPAVNSDVIGVEGTNPDHCAYRVVPFGIVADMTRSTRMAQEDDAQWLARALNEAAEIPVSRGLLVRQGMGSALGDTWLGNVLVEEVAAPDLTDANATAATISEGRRIFFQKTLGLQPILHVNPTNAVALRKAGVVELDPQNGEDRTVWGDTVVISEGYYDIPDLTAVPVAFWTGPIKVTKSEVATEDVVRAIRQNLSMNQVTMVAAIDTLPCAMVRIGAAPAPVAP